MGAALVTVPTTATLWKFVTGTSPTAHCGLVPVLQAAERLQCAASSVSFPHTLHDALRV